MVRPKTVEVLAGRRPMFRISTKGRYGTRLMLNLALHYQDGQKARSLKEVAEEEAISIRYLEQIIIPLRVHRLVKSLRGAGGGYALTRNPAAISLSQVLLAVEGNCCLTDCLEEGAQCPRMSSCAAYEIWKEATRIMKEYFDSVSLEDLVIIARKKASGQSRRPGGRPNLNKKSGVSVDKVLILNQADYSSADFDYYSVSHRNSYTSRRNARFLPALFPALVRNYFGPAI